MDKQEFWPKEGKRKKGLIILTIIVTAALLITLLEAKTGFKQAKSVSFVIVAACIAVWFYKPQEGGKQPSN